MKLSFAVAVFLSLPIAPAYGADTPPIKILLPSTYHRGEIAAKSGETWFGIYEDESGSRVKKTKIKVEPVFDPVADENEHSHSGLRVSATVEINSKQPTFLIKGMASIREGLVQSGLPEVAGLAQNMMELSQPLTIRFNGQAYLLSIVDRSLMFTKGHFKQQLCGAGDPDNPPTILWSGDLDNDGKIDVLVMTYPHYDQMSYSLFLSSAAAPGKALREVARLVATGC
jgi:hypothetical protein